MEAAAGVAAARGSSLPMPSSRKEWRAVSDHHSVRNVGDEVVISLYHCWHFRFFFGYRENAGILKELRFQN